MKGITLCADCAYYDLKKHKCNRGATVDPDISKGHDVRFYVDCPLPDVQEVQLRPAKPITNADRIRQMTDEELAKTMRSCNFCAYLDKGCQHNGTCTQGFLEWLKQEVTGDAGSKTD